MKLGIPDDSVPVQEMFEGFFAEESSPARVRAAEPLGFDAALWRELVATEAPFMRLSADAGGGGMSLFDCCLMMEQAGRRLARSEEHTSELQSLMGISYAVFCLKKQ